MADGCRNHTQKINDTCQASLVLATNGNTLDYLTYDFSLRQFEVRFERKFPIVGLYFLTLPVETLRNLCPVEKLFGMRMAGLGQFYWLSCYYLL